LWATLSASFLVRSLTDPFLFSLLTAGCLSTFSFFTSFFSSGVFGIWNQEHETAEIAGTTITITITITITTTTTTTTTTIITVRNQ
jgi:hypothetical protein